MRKKFIVIQRQKKNDLQKCEFLPIIFLVLRKWNNMEISVILY